MSQRSFSQITTSLLYFGVLFMIGESLVHFSGVRLASVADWPSGAMSFSYFFQCLWASVSVLLAWLLWTMAKNKSLWPLFMVPVGLFAIFHGLVLWWWSTRGVTEAWQFPSLFVWNPWYSFQLKIEASILMAYGAWILFGNSKGWLKKP